jgi:hypothetical protein
VLLIAGHSGAGKSTAAAELGRRFGLPWLQVDDLRLVLQASAVTLPVGTDDLYFFVRTPDVWRLPPERLRDGLIAVGRALLPALEMVISHHLHRNRPLIIEGDGILPELATRATYHVQPSAGRVHAVVLIDPEWAGPGGRAGDDEQQGEQARAIARAQAEAAWRYGQWLAGEGERCNLPVLPARPWATLADRIVGTWSARTPRSR